MTRSLRAAWRILCFTLVLTAPVARADITVTIELDGFDVYQYLDTSGGNPASNAVTDGTLIGGGRIFTFDTSPSTTIFNRLRADDGGNSQLLLSTEGIDASTSTVTYDGWNGTTSPGLSDFDVTTGGGTHFFMRMNSLDLAADWTLTLDDGTNQESELLSLSPGSGDVLMPFSNFSTIDLTQLESIEFEIQSVSTGLDFAFDSFGVGYDAIPEPSTSILIAVAFFSGMLGRQRR